VPARNIVVGQEIAAGMTERSRELRRTMTPGEKILWEALRGRRLRGLRFRRQQIIGRFIVDFYCHSAGLIVEVDGPIHDQQTDRDRERDAFLRGLGLNILRVSDENVRTALPAVLVRIATVANRR
jgi:very-short-patch-repair endonuclease